MSGAIVVHVVAAWHRQTCIADHQPPFPWLLSSGFHAVGVGLVDVGALSPFPRGARALVIAGDFLLAVTESPEDLANLVDARVMS